MNGKGDDSSVTGRAALPLTGYGGHALPLVTAFLLGPLLLGQALHVQGTAECPAAADVEARLHDILDFRSAAELKEHALVERNGDSVRVSLTGADGHVIGERTLAVEGSCEDMARAAAVVLATWLGDVHPEFVRPLPPAEPEPPNEADAPAPPAATTPAPRVAQPPVLAPAPELNQSAALGSPSSSNRWAPGAGLGVGIDASGALTPLLSLTGTWAPSGFGWGAAATLILTGVREQALEPGAVRWWRWPLLLGPSLRLTPSGASVELSTGATFAWLHLRGRGFDPNRGADDVSFGSFAAVRLAASSGRWRPFVATTGLFWLRRATAQTNAEAGNETRLPSLDVLLTAGAALDL